MPACMLPSGPEKSGLSHGQIFGKLLAAPSGSLHYLMPGFPLGDIPMDPCLLMHPFHLTLQDPGRVSIRDHTSPLCSEIIRLSGSGSGLD